MDLEFNTTTAPTREAFAEAGLLHFAFGNDSTDITHLSQVLLGKDQSSDTTFLSPSNHIRSQSFVSNQLNFPDDPVATWTFEWELANLRALGLNHYSLNERPYQTE